jgi:hypothetical protein
MKKVRTVLLAMVLSVGLSPSLGSAVAKQPLTKAQALEIVRTLNTAEMYVFLQQKCYSPLDTAAKHFKKQPKGLGELVTSSTNAPSGRIRDYEISLITSSDGKHYKLAMTPVAESPVCTIAFFSDESGRIYSGRALDCSQ